MFLKTLCSQSLRVVGRNYGRTCFYFGSIVTNSKKFSGGQFWNHDEDISAVVRIRKKNN